MSQVRSRDITMDWKLDWLAACVQKLKIKSHMGWDHLSHSIVGPGTVDFQMALFIFILFFFAAIFKLPVILSSNPPPLHSELVISLLKDYNHHLVPLNVSNALTLLSFWVCPLCSNWKVLHMIFLLVFQPHCQCGGRPGHDPHGPVEWDWRTECHCLAQAGLERLQVGGLYSGF